MSRVFVLDVSEGAVRRGVLRYVCEGIRRGLYGSKRKGEEVTDGAEEEEEEVISTGEKVAFITVAETVGFWNLSVRSLARRILGPPTDRISVRVCNTPIDGRIRLERYVYSAQIRIFG